MLAEAFCLLLGNDVTVFASFCKLAKLGGDQFASPVVVRVMHLALVTDRYAREEVRPTQNEGLAPQTRKKQVPAILVAVDNNS